MKIFYPCKQMVKKPLQIQKKINAYHGHDTSGKKGLFLEAKQAQPVKNIKQGTKDTLILKGAALTVVLFGFGFFLRLLFSLKANIDFDKMGIQKKFLDAFVGFEKQAHSAYAISGNAAFAFHHLTA